MSMKLMAEDDWVPAACSLSTAEQPLRRAECDDLFAQDVVSVTQESPRRVRLELRADPDAAARAARLAVQETGCCSLFTFELAITDGRVSLIVSTSAEHESVLAAFGARAESRLGAGA
jgi:hypothetical protein